LSSALFFHSSFKLWFELLKAYIYILIDVVLAPFWIMGSLIPGSPMNVSGWLKDLAANLLAFPVTIGNVHAGTNISEWLRIRAESDNLSPPL